MVSEAVRCDIGYIADLTVLKHNAPRIWDVGEMEYKLVAFMVNELPMEQLTEIEANSPVRRRTPVTTPNTDYIASAEGDRLVMGVSPNQGSSDVLRPMQRAARRATSNRLEEDVQGKSPVGLPVILADMSRKH
jgi:hypothetical protein